MTARPSMEVEKMGSSYGKTWISIRMTKKEKDQVDECRALMSEEIGVKVSRNAFIRNLIFNGLKQRTLANETHSSE